MENNVSKSQMTVLENMDKMLKSMRGMGLKNINKESLPEFESFVLASGLTFKQVAFVAYLMEENVARMDEFAEYLECSNLEVLQYNIHWYCLNKLDFVDSIGPSFPTSLTRDMSNNLLEKGCFPSVNVYSNITNKAAWVLMPMLRCEEGLISHSDFKEMVTHHMKECDLVPEGVESDDLIAFLAVCMALYEYRDTRTFLDTDFMHVYTQNQLEAFKREVQSNVKLQEVVDVVNGQIMYVKDILDTLNKKDDDDDDDDDDEIICDIDDDDDNESRSPFSGWSRRNSDDGLYVKISCDDIVEKPMFYNDQEQSGVNDLQNLLNEENYAKVCERMSKKGMRKGFQVLLSGGPGTGKTETVLQLAKMTGRDVVRVDISQIRDKYIGESEHNIKKVFSDYHKTLENSDKHPILLFNEADGLLGERFSKVDSGGEKMENAMQNIILQEMEDFEGIMIATTNLIGVLDDAFERRFLYKMVFDKPGKEVRAKLWVSKVDGLKAEDAQVLAEKYDLSGGQIDNVVRKLSINQVLYGYDDVSLEKLTGLCDKELWNKKKKIQKLGFMSA